MRRRRLNSLSAECLHRPARHPQQIHRFLLVAARCHDVQTRMQLPQRVGRPLALLDRPHLQSRQHRKLSPVRRNPADQRQKLGMQIRRSAAVPGVRVPNSTAKPDQAPPEGQPVRGQSENSPTARTIGSEPSIPIFTPAAGISADTYSSSAAATWDPSPGPPQRQSSTALSSP